MNEFQLKKEVKNRQVNLFDIEDFNQTKKVVNLMNFENFGGDSFSIDEDLKKYIFDLYKIQEQLKDTKDATYSKEIIDNLNSINEIIKKSNSITKNLLLRNIIIKSDYLKRMLEKGVESKYIISKIDDIITEIKNLYFKDSYLSSNSDTDKKQNILFENNDYEIKQFFLDLSKIDLLYKKLYDAINNNDIKKITLYRGRIIRELKNNKDVIEKYYNDISPLIAINEIMNDDNIDNKLSSIKKIIEESREKKYFIYLEKNISNIESFKNAKKKVYALYKVEKIMLYKNALNEELKFQRNDLKRRYSKELLDKKITIFNLPIVLVNSVGLSILKLNNTIIEIKEAKTNRRKNEKIKEALKDLGIVITTPVINLGKFGLDNWYTLYNIYHSFSIMKQKEEDVLEDENKDKTTEENTKVNQNEENNDKLDKNDANSIEEKNNNEPKQIEKEENVESNNNVQSNEEVSAQQFQHEKEEVQIDDNIEQSNNSSIENSKDVSPNTTSDNTTESNILSEVVVDSEINNTNNNLSNIKTNENTSVENNTFTKEYMENNPLVDHIKQQSPLNKKEYIGKPNAEVKTIEEFKAEQIRKHIQDPTNQTFVINGKEYEMPNIKMIM